MDTFTQGILGASLSQSFSDRDNIRKATLTGLLAGMLPDADIFLHSFKDPLFGLLIHRHFSHSLAFIPLGALIAALLLFPFLKKTLRFSKIYLYAFLGYSTAGLLDACTTYGTYLFWPFSDKRVAWDNISIIDPIFTLPLGVMVYFAFRRKKAVFAVAGFVFAVIYLLLGVAARDAANAVLLKTVNSRGHAVSEIKVMPSLGNIFLWRGIYESEGFYHINAVRIGILADPIVYHGTSVKKFEMDDIMPKLNPDSVLYRDIRRFEHFADGWLGFHPSHPDIIGDMRYAALPNNSDPLWGIRIHPDNPDNHVELVYFRDFKREDLAALFRMLFGYGKNNSQPSNQK
jgi:inner membrane protein